MSTFGGLPQRGREAENSRRQKREHGSGAAAVNRHFLQSSHRRQAPLSAEDIVSAKACFFASETGWYHDYVVPNRGDFFILFNVFAVKS